MLSRYSLEQSKLSKLELEELVQHMADGEKRNSDDVENIDLKNAISTSKATIKKSNKSLNSISKYFTSFTRIGDNDEPGMCQKCCCGAKSGDKLEFEAVAASVMENKHKMPDLTFPEFLLDISNLTRKAKDAFHNLNDVKMNLEYANDPSAEAQGLSRMGGYVWMITYAVQHLVNPMGKKVNLVNELIPTQELYETIAAGTHRLAFTMRNFAVLLNHYRECAAWIVRKAEKIFLLEESPFTLKPEAAQKIKRIKRRIGLSIDETATEDDEHGGLFHVQWSPLTVLVQLKPNEKFDTFVSLDVYVKLNIIEVFMKEAVNMSKSTTDNIENAMKAVGLKPSSDEADVVSMKSDLTRRLYPIIHYLNKSKTEKHDEKDIFNIQRVVNDFWFTVEAAQAVGREVETLIHESRDIVRSCYIYTTQFYHWKLTNYDSFEPLTFPQGRRPTRTTLFFAKIMGSRRISDNLLFLSLADFTSSIYQYISQENPIKANGMTLELEAFEDNDSTNETWGLVPGAFDNLRKYSDKGDKAPEPPKPPFVNM